MRLSPPCQQLQLQLINIITTLVTAFVTALPMLVTAGVSIITALVNAFVTMLPLIFDCWFTNFDGINHWDYDDFYLS